MHLFSSAYCKKACDQIKSIRILCLCSIFVALQVISASAFIQVSENLRIYFSFFFTALFSCIGGPLMALICGFTADIINFILFPSGAFFFGYTLSSMLGALVFALLLWDTKITIVKLALSRIIINVFINILLGSVWSAMLYSNGYIYYVIKSAAKNLALLPVEIILLVLMFKMLMPFLYRKHLTKSSSMSII